MKKKERGILIMKIKSIDLRQGVFNDNNTGRQISYANYYLAIETDNNASVFGKKYEVVKVKKDEFESAYKGDLKLICDVPVLLIYDFNKKLRGIQVVRS